MSAKTNRDKKNTSQPQPAEKKPAQRPARKPKPPREDLGGYTVDYRQAYGEKDTGKEREREPVPDREEVLPPDVESDDFLPQGENDPDEEILTKGERDAPESEALPIPPAPGGTAIRTARSAGRYRYGVFLGSLVLLLALVGVVFIAVTVGQRIYHAATDDTQLRVFDTMLAPIVMQDPKPFDNPAQADELFVQNASLWKAITVNNGMNYTDYDESGRMLVPLGDVAAACRTLFGPDCELHPKMPPEETFYEYDTEKNAFRVAMFSSDSGYTPYVESSKKNGDVLTLRVGYVSPTDEWRNQTESAVSGPTPTKYMEYDMKYDAESEAYYLYAVRSLEDER